MTISIITLFPEVFQPILNSSILKRAQEKGKVTFKLINLRDFGEGRHKVVDDRPYGGGVGMILKADVLARAVQSSRLVFLASRSGDESKRAKLKVKSKKSKVVLTSASGKSYKQQDAQRFSKLDHLIIVCGHYEGVDQRFIDKYVDEELSIGDYVLTGGEIPAMVITDSVVRLIPGTLEKPEAIKDESFSTFHHPSSNFQTLEYPQYTRPDVFEGKKVPKVLLSGNHQEIEKWRQDKSLEKTRKIRSDLLAHI